MPRKRRVPEWSPGVPRIALTFVRRIGPTFKMETAALAAGVFATMFTFSGFRSTQCSASAECSQVKQICNGAQHDPALRSSHARQSSRVASRGQDNQAR
jgi:hypothetical protein